MTHKKAKQSDYAAVCAQLGFYAETKFVEITSAGSIGFTCGKPEEVLSLAAAVQREGYRMSRELIAACKRADGYWQPRAA